MAIANGWKVNMVRTICAWYKRKVSANKRTDDGDQDDVAIGCRSGIRSGNRVDECRTTDGVRGIVVVGEWIDDPAG
jgi:hypothetical protein